MDQEKVPIVESLGMFNTYSVEIRSKIDGLVRQALLLRNKMGNKMGSNKMGSECTFSMPGTQKVHSDPIFPWDLDEQHVSAPTSSGLSPLANVAYRRAEPHHAA
jgi:hypothetical protein